VDDWTKVKVGEKYVVVTVQDGVTFKILYNQIQEKENVLLCSSNPLYKPFEVFVHDIKEMWRYRLMMV
jgi:phage repressor protein C with HTH and peptisase S24 domain